MRLPSSAERLLLRVDEAARMCGWSRSHLYNAINRGELPTVTLGRTRRIPRKWLEDWIAVQVTEWEAARKGAMPHPERWLRERQEASNKKAAG